MTRYAVLIAVMLLAAVAGSRAVLGQDARRVYGAGTNTCDAWTESRKGDTWFTAGQWILGYVSAANQYSRSAPMQSDARSLARWVDEHCLDNPGDDLSDAAKALVEFLLQPGGGR